MHDRVGYRLATALIHKIFDAVPDRFEADLAQASFAIAERILMAEPPADPGRTPFFGPPAVRAGWM
jgi:hypothetical protein